MVCSPRKGNGWTPSARLWKSSPTGMLSGAAVRLLVGSPPQMRDHLQHDELSKAIAAFLGDPTQSHLVVHEPDTAQQLDFIRWYGGEPVLRIALPHTATEERNRASSLGFTDDRGLPQMILRLSRDPTEAREACLAALLFVLQIDPLAWLWITPVWEYDEWPVPLPKPVPWPPAAR